LRYLTRNVTSALLARKYPHEKNIMNNTAKNLSSKVPEITLIFWIIKIAATTLGETGGDTQPLK